MSRLAGLAEGSALAANILFAGRADALRELTARMCSPTGCLRRQSQPHRLTWWKMMRLAERWLPSPRLRHLHPDWRFDALTRDGRPVL
jgi:hypothetical protein